MERKLVGPHLRLVDSRPAKTAPRSSVSKAAAKAKLDSAEQLLPFPSGSLTYGSWEAAFRAIGLDKGSPWAVDSMADSFGAGFTDRHKLRTEVEQLRYREACGVRYAETTKSYGEWPSN